MPANNRTYYAIQAIGLAKLGATSYTAIHGLQTFGLNLNFSLDDILEIGQIELYESKENTPEVEVTLEKVLDGYPLIYHLATRGYAANTFAGRQNQRTTLAANVYGDTQSSASGVAVRQLIASGLYYSRVGYNFSADGNFTESVTLVGNNLRYSNSPSVFTGTIFDNTDVPLALTSGLGGVQRRQNFVWDTNVATRDTNGMVDATDASILPPDIPGISSSGTNDKTGGVYGAHVLSAQCNVDVGRDQIFELGRLGPYYRYATIPAEVTSEFEIIALNYHTVQADEDSTSNLTNRTIKLKTQEGTFIDLGTKNRLTSVQITGGDTGGGNQTIRFSYKNLNSWTVSHPQDPT